MRKFALAAALAAAFLASGCAEFQKLTGVYQTVSTATVDPQRVVVAIATFQGLEALGDAYIKLPLCGQTQSYVCRTAAIRKTVYAALVSGRQVRDSLKNYLRANPNATAVPVANYNSLIGYVNTLQGALASYKAALGQ